MAQVIREQYIVDQKGKPTAVILDIQKYRKMVSLVQERLDRKESKLLSQSKHFKKDGNLPEGVYSAGEEEFLDRFATNSSRRKWLGERLKEIFTLAKATGKLKRIFVWGSFVSVKQSPNDI